MLKEILKSKPEKRELKRFGVIMGCILIAWGLIALWRGKSFYLCFFVAAPAPIAMGLIFPSVLRPLQLVMFIVYRSIMYLVTQLAMCVTFYLVFTSVGLISKLLKRDMLKQKIDRQCESYWVMRDESAADKVSYENQF